MPDFRSCSTPKPRAETIGNKEAITPIQIKAYASIVENRNDTLGEFAITKLSDPDLASPGGRVKPLAHAHTEARVERIGKSRDCTRTPTAVQVRVMPDIEFYSARIVRGIFDPDRMTGHVADAPANRNHSKLDQENVRAHEQSHALEIVETVQAAVQRHLNWQGVVRQMKITMNREKESEAYYKLHDLIRRKVEALAMAAYRERLRDFAAHDTASRTEKNAREAQKTEFANRWSATLAP